MLKKLMKYEFMATGRVFLPLYAALLFIAVVNRFISKLNMPAPSVIGVALSIILIVGIIALLVILTLQRFRSNLMSDEGYLMLTLPVRADQLILSKLFTAAVWCFASVCVVAGSIMVMAMPGVEFQDVVRFFSNIYTRFTMQPLQSVVYAAELAVTAILGLLSWLLLLYACLSLSMFVNRRRILFAFGAFIVISSVMQTIAATIVSIASSLVKREALAGLFAGMSVHGWAQTILAFIIVAEVIACVVFYFTSRYMLKNRLNLQ